MKSLRRTFYAVIFLTVIFLIWAAMLPEKLRIEKSYKYELEKDSLFTLVSDFENWKSWFPWKDSSMDIKTENEKGEGQMLKWDHPEEGKGYFKMLRIHNDTLIKTEISFIEGAPSVLSDIELISKSTGGTELKWILYDTVAYEYPLGRVRVYLIEKMAGQNIEKALNDLDKNIKPPE